MELFRKKAILKNFAKLRWKHQCQSLFFNKIATVGLIIKSLWQMWIAVGFMKIFGTAFYRIPMNGYF